MRGLRTGDNEYCPVANRHRVIGFRAAAVKRRTINTLNAFRQICRAMINAIDRIRGDNAATRPAI